MLLTKLSIRNYKSLRNIVFVPSSFSAIVGPNAAGKSNFADSVHFLSEVYSQGLEVAIARKGGYENIAFRQQRRSKSAIEFEIVLEVDGEEREVRSSLIRASLRSLRENRFRFVHKFSIITAGSGIKAAFRVKNESLCIWMSKKRKENNGNFLEIAKVSRSAQNKIKVNTLDKNPLSDHLKKFEDAHNKYYSESVVGEQGLIMTGVPLGRVFSSVVSKFEVYQFSTTVSRSPGVPTPNPKLSSAGENLPALVDWLQREHPDSWKIVMSGMRDVLQGLTEISTQYLHTKTLGIFFSEEGVGRPWSIDDVSDGTIHALAMLVASVDPRSRLLIVEEPENSVHPWILRVIMERFREVSKSKNVIVTSHSPTLINLLQPHEIWIAFRKGGETQLNKLIDLDPSVTETWKEGAFQLSDLLDSGSISQAVPGGVF